MKFQKIPVPDSSAREDDKRVRISMSCDVRQGSRAWQRVRVDEISRTGFRIPHLAMASPDLPLRIRIPGMSVLTATIRWHSGHSVGCEFVEPLHIAVFDHLVGLLR
jgi:hypothetical protein